MYHPVGAHLLEDLPVRPLVRLTSDDNRLVPRPHALDEVFVLLGVELRERVALVVRGDVEGGFGVLAADDEGALDDGVVGHAVHGRGAEDVFAGGFEAGEETAWCGLAGGRQMSERKG